MFQGMNREELMVVDGGGWYEDLAVYAAKIGKSVAEVYKSMSEHPEMWSNNPFMPYMD